MEQTHNRRSVRLARLVIGLSRPVGRRLLGAPRTLGEDDVGKPVHGAVHLIVDRLRWLSVIVDHGFANLAANLNRNCDILDAAVKELRRENC